MMKYAYSCKVDVVSEKADDLCHKQQKQNPTTYFRKFALPFMFLYFEKLLFSQNKTLNFEF